MTITWHDWPRRLRDYVADPVDIAPLAAFRILFGLLITLESWGAIATGWVRSTLVEPEHLFTFIGFGFLESLRGPGMYAYFALMGAAGIAIMLGWRYRLTALLFALLWSGAYLMQKASYNNHYYLLFLLAWIMAFLPAHRFASADVRSGRLTRREHMPRLVKLIIIGQLLIVYTYASLAKFYPDWLDTTFIRLLMEGRKDYPLIGELLQHPWVHYGMMAYGIAYDGLVIPALLWKPTRKWAFGLSVFFHLYNSITLGIGIFPYLALAFTVFFFEEDRIRRLFFPSAGPKPLLDLDFRFKLSELIRASCAIYLLVQLLLPLRHLLIPGNVFWTEEGHRLSWRMMLRSRSGRTTYFVEYKNDGRRERVNPADYGLNAKQRGRIEAQPDFIWQFAQKIRERYAREGIEVGVYVDARARINDHAMQPLIDPEVDLTGVPWKHLFHNEWILLQDPYYDGR